MLIYLQMIDSEEDRILFEQLYLAYRQLMFYVANSILHNDQDAEDAVHQAFLSILDNLGKISNVECPKTKAFCVTIVEHKAIDVIRARRHDSLEELDEADRGMEFPIPGDGGLADALARLPAQYREILLLHFYMGYSTRELERILSLTKSAVLKRMWRAKEALKEQLEREDKADER